MTETVKTISKIERDQKKASANLTGKKAESAARLGMGFGGMRYFMIYIYFMIYLSSIIEVQYTELY